MSDLQDPMLLPSSTRNTSSLSIKLTSHQFWKWWFLVGLHVIFVIGGQLAGILFTRFYYEQGGHSEWIVTFLGTAGFPILLIPLLLNSYKKESSCTPAISLILRALVPIFFGVYITLCHILNAIGLSNLPASSYSLIYATQLIFNVIFSYLINSQNITAAIINSVVILTLSTSLVAISEVTNQPTGEEIGGSNYVLGIMCTLGAAAIYSSSLCFLQLSFQRILRTDTYKASLEVMFFIQVSATFVSSIALSATGQWKNWPQEMASFGRGKALYVFTQVGIAIGWQFCTIGVMGLVYMVSSLFTNVINTVSLGIIPVASMIVFNDRMNAVKLIAMILSIWGSSSYTYQNYLDTVQ